MSEIHDNWERLVAAVLRKVKDLELCYASSRSSSLSSISSSDRSSTTFGFRLEIEKLLSSDLSSSNWERLVCAVLRREALWELFHAHSRSPSVSSTLSSDCSSTTFSFRLEIENLQLSDFNSSFRSCVEIEELQSSDIGPSFGSCVEIEELQSSDIGPSFESCVEIEELAPDECVRSSDSKDDETTKEIMTAPRQEDRITRFSKFQENKLTFTCFPIFRGIFQRRDAMISRDAVTSVGKIKLVWELAFADDKSKRKAMKIAIGASGVETVQYDVKDGKLTVVGHGIDVVDLARSLRSFVIMPAKGARAQEKS